MKKFLVVFFFMLFFIHKNSFPQEIIGVTEELPGIIEVQGDTLKGIAIQKVRKILKKLKIKENIQVYPWARSYELAKRNKNYFIFPMAKNPEREKYFKFAGIIFNIKTFVYKRNMSDIKIKNIQDIKKYTACVVRNDVRDQYLTEHGFTNLVRFADQENVIHGIITKKCDIAICAENIEYLWKKTLKQDMNSLVKRSLHIKEIDGDRYLSFNKDTDDKVIKKFTAALKELK
jgi:polar amino acid transport system substrate-binding protein